MSPQPWETAKRHFEAASSLPPDERETYLDSAIGNDAETKAEVIRLLEEFNSAQTTLSPGELIAGRYRIDKLIGRGGMGEVYEARDQLLNEPVALKTLRPALARNEETVKRFQKEIHLARKVTHPHVCRVFEAGVHQFADGHGGPLLFFTMEMLTGELLSTRIRRQALTPAEAFPLAIQMAEGLHAAHQMGIVHADFKSSNVMLVQGTGGPRAVITDFGLARISATAISQDDETQTSSRIAEGKRKLAGTVVYMSPEQMGGGTLTAASDIYSFGIVLYEMATGKLPFVSSEPIGAALERGSGESITARTLVPGLDDRWDAAITRCLRWDPSRRFASAQELANWFRRDSWLPHLLWTRRQWTRAGIGGVVLVGAAGGLWTWLRRPYRPAPAAVGWYGRGVAALHSMTYEAARKALEQAVAADPRFALAHASLARAYDELDYTDRAKESMLAAVSLSQETRLGGADMEKLRALQYQISRDYDRAAPLLQRIEQSAGDAERAAAALECGWVAQQRERTEEAAAAYERALKADPGYAAAKLRLGYIQGRRRQVAEALKTFQEAEALYLTASDSEGVTEALLQRASLLNRSSRAAEAMPVIGKAMSVARPLGNTYQEIRLRLLESATARNLGDGARASALAQEAVDAATAQRMENVATGGLIDLGNSFITRGEFPSAERYYRQALEFARRSKARRSEARAQASLGSLCEQTSRPEEAKHFIEAALPFYRSGGYRRELIQTALIMGSVQEQLGEYEEGARILREALAFQDSQIEALARQRLGEILREQGAWPDALAEFLKATNVALPVNQTAPRLLTAGMMWRLGRHADAEQLFAEVERGLAARPNPAIRADLVIHRAEIAYAEGRWNAALELVRQRHAEEHAAVLIAAVSMIRSQRESDGVELGNGLLRKLEAERLVGKAARARLMMAQALTAGGNQDLGLRLAEESLSFFEPRKIWESVWRAHAAASHASGPGAVAAAHTGKARAALAGLRNLWPSTDVETYLRRPDIAVVFQGLG